MSSAALAPDKLLPRPPGGLAPGALLALLVHGLLIIALTAGVGWRSSPTEVVSAELWAAVPQSAAPRAVEAPTPAPVAPAAKVEPAPQPAPAPSPPPKPAPRTEPAAPDAQIAIERARREAVERERASKERADKLKAERDLERERERLRTAEAERLKQADAAKKRDAEQRLADQRAENLKRMLGQAGATGSPTGSPTATGTAARDAGPSASYVGRLVASIKPNIVFNEVLPGNPAAEVEVRAASSGTIISRRLIKSSGNKDWDDAVLRAVDRTGSLPRDTDGRVPPSIVISFRPQE